MFDFYKGAEFVGRELETVAFVVDPLVPGSGVTMLHGPPGARKSTLAWQLGNAVVKGEEFLGYPTTAAPVLLINLDMPKYALHYRWRKTRFTPSFDLLLCGNSLDITMPSFKNADIYKECQRLISENHYRLIIIDALGQLCATTVTNDEAPKRVYGCLREWLGDDRAILLIHHDRKRGRGGDGRLADRGEEDAAGSQFWRAYAITQLHLYRATKDVYRLEHTKSQITATVEPMELLTAPGGAALIPRLTAQATRDDNKLKEAEERLDREQPAWRKETQAVQVALLSAASGVSERTIYRWLKH